MPFWYNQSMTKTQETSNQGKETPSRSVQFGRIYDHLEPGGFVNIAALGDIRIHIDEENLGLERVSLESLQKGWERDQDWFSKYCMEQGINVDPFEAYKYYQIQHKVFQVLGMPQQNSYERDARFRELGDNVKLSDMKMNAMCSEFAILSAYLAQKIGEPVHLILGSAVNPSDPAQWRESHMYVWVDRMNCIFDCVAARDGRDFPALMIPTAPASIAKLETGMDIEAKRVGSNFKRIYGLEAGGFGTTMDQPSLPKTSN